MKFRSYLLFFIISFFCLLSTYSYGTDQKTIEVKMKGSSFFILVPDVDSTDTLHQLKKKITSDIISKLGDDFEYYFLDKLKERAEDHFLIKDIISKDNKIYIEKIKKPEEKKEKKTFTRHKK
jgi:hypothetical protein